MLVALPDQNKEELVAALIIYRVIYFMIPFVIALLIMAYWEVTLFLEGTPEIARYDVIRVGTDVKEQLENDLKLELSGVAHYNEAIDLCSRVKDNGTREILEVILTESEEHVDWLEQQLNLIEQVGLPNHLQAQMGSSEEEGD